MKNLIKSDKPVLKAKEVSVISSLSNSFYKKKDNNPYSIYGTTHNEALSIIAPLLLKDMSYEASRNKAVEATISFFRSNKEWSISPIYQYILEYIVPICFPEGGPFDDFGFLGGGLLKGNTNLNVDSSMFPLFYEVYNSMDKTLDSLDITREDQVKKVLDNINAMENELKKVKNIDKIDLKMSYVALSVFENSLLFWNDFDGIDIIQAKTGGPKNIVAADVIGTVTSLIPATLSTGYPPVAILGGISASWGQAARELFS